MTLTNAPQPTSDFYPQNPVDFPFRELVFGESSNDQKLEAISRAYDAGNDAPAQLLFLHGYLKFNCLDAAVRQAVVEALRSLTKRVDAKDENTASLLSDVALQIADFDAKLQVANSTPSAHTSTDSSARCATISNQIEEAPLQDDVPASLVKDILGCPAIPLSAGNVFLAVGTAEPLGVALSAVTNLTTIGLKVVEHYTGRKLGLPFYVLSAVNAATATSVVCRGVNTVGIDSLLSFQTDAMKFVLGAGAFTAWSVGHALAGYHQGQPDKNTTPLKNEQTWYGVGDVAAVHGNPISTTFFLVGLMKALTGDNQKQTESSADEVGAFRPFFEKHVTPARMYGVGYILGSLLSIEQPLSASAQAAWGLGYLNFDAAKNKDFISDIKSLMQRSFDWMCSEMLTKNLCEPSLIDKQAPEEGLNIAELLIQSFSSIDRLRLVTGFSRERLWDRVSQTLSHLYPMVSEPSKDYAFALLEVAACHSVRAWDTIESLASQGDQRALAKTRRLTEHLLFGSGRSNPNMAAIAEAKTLFRSLRLAP
jgi:hypothetical protein